MRIEEIDAKPWHCGQIIHKLRHEHVAALHRVGKNVHEELRSVFDASSTRRAWLIDGKLAAIGGVHGTVLESTGYCWMALSEEATQHSMTIVREVQRQLSKIMVVKRELATTIIGGDEAAKRLAIFLGFHVKDDGLGSPAFSKTGRLSLSEYLDGAVDLRVPLHLGYVIPMGYHAEEH